MKFRFQEERAQPEYVKRIAVRCHRVPLCIACTRIATYRRVKKALDQFSMCTPKGQEMRLTHIVQTAPLTEDGQGWGRQASEDIGAFGKVVWDTLRESYGKDGLGAIMSYQDFGERAFNKRHPHMDLTLNGWMLQDGQPVQTPTYDLTGRGRERWDEIFVKHARAVAIDAQRGSLDIGRTKIGHRAYYRILRYQMRELVDLTRIEYDSQREVLWWEDYKTSHRERVPVPVFLEGMAEYQRRLGTWTNKGEHQLLHRRYGHIADKLRHRTAGTMGGQPIAHGEDCPCAECGDWDSIELTDEEFELNQRGRITIEA